MVPNGAYSNISHITNRLTVSTRERNIPVSYRNLRIYSFALHQLNFLDSPAWAHCMTMKLPRLTRRRIQTHYRRVLPDGLTVGDKVAGLQSPSSTETRPVSSPRETAPTLEILSRPPSPISFQPPIHPFYGALDAFSCVYLQCSFNRTRLFCPLHEPRSDRE